MRLLDLIIQEYITIVEIFVVDKETRKTIAKVETYEEAEEAAEEYEGDAGADIVFYE